MRQRRRGGDDGPPAVHHRKLACLIILAYCRLRQQPDVSQPLVQALPDRIDVGAVDGEAHCPMGGAEACHQGKQEAGSSAFRACDGHFSRKLSPLGPERERGPVCQLDERLSPLAEEDSILCERDALVPALDETHSKLILELCDLARERRLGQVEDL